ncbi:hypothetical protein GOV11_00440 [Candidatus Woesearchaeota archaeon]|nr:hypothetical protein [Candidatus Woesearchaeota archaeon]
MADERTYTIPLRKGFMNTPRYKRAKKAVTTLRAFLVRHMKTEDVRIGQHLNEFIWQDGIKSPPPRVKVTVSKTKDGIVQAELFGKKYKDVAKPKELKEAPQGLKEKLQAAVGKKDTTSEEDAPEEEKPDKEPVKDKPKTQKVKQPSTPKK